MTRARWTSAALFASLLVGAGCPSSDPAAATKPTTVAKAEPKADATKTAEPPKTDAAPAKTATRRRKSA